MSTTTWVRPFLTPQPWNVTKQWWQLTTLTAGQKIARIRFGWGFGGTTGLTIVPTSVMGLPMVLGLNTTIGPAATDRPQDPIGQSGDQAPPASRWLWWEQRYPTVASWDAAGNTVAWRHSDAQEPTDARGQVIAPTMTGGNTLNLWMVFRSSSTWDTSGTATVWGWASVLVVTPL